MYRTILDGQLVTQPTTEFSLKPPTDVSVKMRGAPRWIWLEQACEQMPDDQVLAVKVPDGETCARYASTIRCALTMAKWKYKWSVRQSSDGRWVVIAKAGQWPVSAFAAN